MKEKLKELKSLRRDTKSKLESIECEIQQLEKEMLDECEKEYKGKWFCKETTQYDESEQEYCNYNMVYVKHVNRLSEAITFSVIEIRFAPYGNCEFCVEKDNVFFYSELQDFEEADEDVLLQLDYAIADRFLALTNIRPSCIDQLEDMLHVSTIKE